MELAGVLVKGKDRIVCIISLEDQYQEYVVYKNGEVDIRTTFKKSQYTDYEHFALVFGKFEPYVFFARKPIPIKDIRFETLEEALSDVKLPKFVMAVEVDDAENS